MSSAGGSRGDSAVKNGEKARLESHRGRSREEVAGHRELRVKEQTLGILALGGIVTVVLLFRVVWFFSRKKPGDIT